MGSFTRGVGQKWGQELVTALRKLVPNGDSLRSNCDVASLRWRQFVIRYAHL